MRDPEGTLQFEERQVVRSLYQPLGAHFLRGPAAAALVLDQKLIPFNIADPQTIVSPRIGFVTHPYEWCDAQFVDAAKLTLDVSESALTENCELKDGSAWNVVFAGTRPMFCDHLSFQSITQRNWWAFAQFVRHFIFPLCLSRYRGLNANDAFKLMRDGLTPECVRGLMGLRRFFTRYWPLMITLPEKPVSVSRQSATGSDSRHANLYATTRALLNGVSNVGARKSTWSGYVGDRVHYSDAATQIKRDSVSKWIDRIKPEWAIDFGCNTGEFSFIAQQGGAQVIAIDLDHEAVQKLYRTCPDNQTLYPVCANLDDLTGGRGWCGTEFPGLMQRLQEKSDVVLMLALVHHLAISNAVPYEKIAEMASRVTKRHLIIELLGEDDPLVKRLSAQRNRPTSDFSLDRQRAALSPFFQTLEEIDLPGGTRHLLLMEKLTRT